MKNIDRNDDFGDGYIYLNCDKEAAEIVQVEYYPWADHDIKYVATLHLEEEPKGTVSFYHQQIKISDITLSQLEARNVFNSLSELTMPWTLWSDLTKPCLTTICPDIKSAIVINTNINKTKFEWLSSDSINNPGKYQKLDKLTDMISNLIDPNTSNLWMPKYL